MLARPAAMLARSAALAGLIVCSGTWTLGSCQAEDNWTRQRAELDASFHEQLEALGRKCDELGLADAARTTRSWSFRRDPHKLYVFLVADADPTAPAPGSPLVVEQWYGRFRKVRAAYAAGLWQLANDAVTAERPELAYRLLHEVVREDPDHESGRRMLGYRRRGKKWQKAVPGLRTRRGRTRRPEFGGRARRYWVVETEHYQVETDYQRQAAVDLARHLEQLYGVWQQVFVPFWISPPLLRRAWDQAAPLAPPGGRHRVVLFRDRDQYVKYLQAAEPRIGITLGIYRHPERTAYFHGDLSDRAAATWRHEATHQLFHETLRAPDDIGANANFWIVEGAALYMESLEPHDGYCSLGGLEAPRLQYARYRALSEQFYVPLEDLVSRGRRQIQADKNIRRLYSQAAGLTHFLMHGVGGRYRRPMMDYLRAVYQQRDDSGSLARQVEVPLGELDVQYHQFLQVTDHDLATLSCRKGLINLALGHTAITDAGWVRLPELPDLQWLDLAYCDITDKAVSRLQSALKLRQCNLEHTRITDAALDTIGRLSELQELDLSHTQVTDDGLARLSGLHKLTVLWLTGTRVTDAGLSQLGSLKQLRMLEVTGTQVSPAAVQQLRQRLPFLGKAEAADP